MKNNHPDTAPVQLSKAEIELTMAILAENMRYGADDKKGQLALIIGKHNLAYLSLMPIPEVGDDV